MSHVTSNSAMWVPPALGLRLSLKGTFVVFWQHSPIIRNFYLWFSRVREVQLIISSFLTLGMSDSLLLLESFTHWGSSLEQACDDPAQVLSPTEPYLITRNIPASFALRNSNGPGQQYSHLSSASPSPRHFPQEVRCTSPPRNVNCSEHILLVFFSILYLEIKEKIVPTHPLYIRWKCNKNPSG